MRSLAFARVPAWRRAALVLHRYDWLLVLLAAPALLFPSPARSLALLLIVAAWVSAWAATGAIVPRTPLDPAILVVLVMVLVSLGVTYDLGVSLAKVTGIVLGVSTFYLLVRRLSHEKAFAWALWGYALLGAAFATAGLFGTDWLYKIPIIDQVVGRLPGLIRGLPGVEEGLQPNYVAGALLLFLPVQLGLLAGSLIRRSPTRQTALLAGLAGLTGLTLILTQSRGGALGLSLGLAMWLAWHGPRARRLLLGGLGVAALAVLIIGPGRVAAGLQAVLGRSLVDNSLARVELWSRALTTIRAFPLTGVGLNGFRHVLPVMFPMFLMPPNYDISHAHNQFLQAALDLGLPGLVAFVALALGAFALLAQVRRRTRRADRRWLAEGLAAALVAQLAYGLADAIAFGARVHLFFWICLAYSVSLYRLTRAEQGAPMTQTA